MVSWAGMGISLGPSSWGPLIFGKIKTWSSSVWGVGLSRWGLQRGPGCPHDTSTPMFTALALGEWLPGMCKEPEQA